jgi:cephalosporin hydroxylase
MKYLIDLSKNTLVNCEDFGNSNHEISLYTKRGVEIISEIWLKQEWNCLHWKSFSWLGFPIWQFPEDLIRLQESIYLLRPEVIIETGINEGGSTIFFASLCKIMGVGRVISIDISIPSYLKESIEATPFSSIITLIEGDSTSSQTIDKVKSMVQDSERVFVFLDSDHSKSHVLNEITAYAPLIKPGSFIVAADGVMELLADTPYGQQSWIYDNPAAAAREFVSLNPDFVISRPPALHGEEYVVDVLTYLRDAWLKRVH